MKTYRTPEIGVVQFDFTVVLWASGEENSLDNLGTDITWNS